MTYRAGAVFISLQGEVTSQTDCGDVATPGSVWIGCTGGPAPDVSAPASASAFDLGDYTCTSQVGTHATLDGKNWFITSGGGGALTLTQNGADVTAHYTGDTELTGALDLTLDAAGTGSAVANQKLGALCQTDLLSQPSLGDLAITAASLTDDAGTIFLSFAGTMTATTSCSGAEKIATLVCTKP